MPADAAAAKDKMSEREKASISGVGGAMLLETVPQHFKTACEKVIAGNNNAYIVLGRDRPGGSYSGYGGLGHNACGTIDITAGRGGSFILSEENPEKLVSAKRIKINPHFMVDASRVYISQKTDVDTNFNLVKGKVGKSMGKAAIALKSDAIRIIAREGIKLVTEGPGGINSKGARKVSTSGIDLIAGNNDSSLEPLVKGNTLVKVLTQVLDNVSEINGIIDAFLTYQLDFNTVLMKHTHPDIINIAIGTIAGDGPEALTKGSTLESPKVVSAGAKNLFALNGIVKKDLKFNKLNTSGIKFKYLNIASKDYINSRFNNTN